MSDPPAFLHDHRCGVDLQPMLHRCEDAVDVVGWLEAGYSTALLEHLGMIHGLEQSDAQRVVASRIRDIRTIARKNAHHVR